MKRIVLLVVASLVLASCARSTFDISGVPDLEVVSVEEFEAGLERLDRAAVVNVWASWCIPCRSEAPLLNAAFDTFGDEVEFIGVNIQDTQPNAKAFLAEFGLDFKHFFDRNRSIALRYGGIGIPITFFFDANGELVGTHNGVIDERRLALGIDELLRSG